MSDRLTLYELNRLVRDALELQLSEAYWVQAELSEVRVVSNGHCYMELVEKTAQGNRLQAKARAVIWADTYALLAPYFERETGQSLSAGLKVLLQVTVQFHELYGYSLTVQDVDPTYTLGDLARRRKEILEKLDAEGVLTMNKELPLPRLAQRIAVISSDTAAGYGDFCHRLERNEYGFRFVVRLFPATMQGNSVERTVIAALDTIADEMDSWDVVAILRGGGAVSDLNGFDTYALAEHCAQFPLPILTGIGHERDDTVIDLVAHTRCKTPTAVASFLVAHQLDTARELEELTQRLPRAFAAVQLRETRRQEQLQLRMELGAGRLLQAHRQHVDTLSSDCRQQVLRLLERQQGRLKLAEQGVRMASPERLLRLGYSLTLKDGKAVRSRTGLKPGDHLVTRLADGEIRSIVESEE